MNKHFGAQVYNQAIADSHSIFTFPNVRFAILTEGMLRIEYHPDGKFDNRPSQVFWYRYQPVPLMQVKNGSDHLSLDTACLHLEYHYSPKGLDRENLQILIKGNNVDYHYGDPNYGLLPGTIRTLDETSGPIRLQHGILSRCGWTLLDDSNSLVFNSNGWIAPRNMGNAYRDSYFLAYGTNYKHALSNYLRIAGNVPMIPRYMLGNWWSRFWKYSQKDLRALVDKFRALQIPLSVLVLDMDWHITKTGNDCSGWTGFSWNHELFPDPPSMLRWLHEQELAITLNLHPASGIYPHEERYHAMVERLGVDRLQDAAIPFDAVDPDFMSAYFDLLLHPLEDQGVDFWWLDWQQGETSRIPHLDPLWWLNHLHFFDLGSRNKKRPIIFSRWGGYGNHRYPIGFSGDTIISWESLAFQPYFTATSANSAYGWWSHDIGGHMRGIEDPELYMRWLQFGLLSPILRIHSGKDIFTDHQPWAFDAETLRLATEVLQLRHAFIPYLYSMARRNNKQALPICTPLYYDHPQQEAAYITGNQYMFGSELMAAPITAPADTQVGMSRSTVWFPPGEWFNFWDGTRICGPQWQIHYTALEDIPLYAKAGAIIPLQTRCGWGGIANPHEIELMVFPGTDSSFELFEDDGVSTDYQNGKYALTRMHSHYTNHHLAIIIDPVSGDSSFIPEKRSYRILVRGIAAPTDHKTLIDQKDIVVKGTYNTENFTFSLDVIPLSSSQQLKVSIFHSESLIPKESSAEQRLFKLLKASRMETMTKSKIYTAFPELSQDIKNLEKMKPSISEDQFIALIETISGAGYSCLIDPQKQCYLILANPKDHSGFRYQLSSSSIPKKVSSEGIILPISSDKATKPNIDLFGLITKKIK